MCLRKSTLLKRASCTVRIQLSSWLVSQCSWRQADCCMPLLLSTGNIIKPATRENRERERERERRQRREPSSSSSSSSLSTMRDTKRRHGFQCSIKQDTASYNSNVVILLIIQSPRRWVPFLLRLLPHDDDADSIVKPLKCISRDVRPPQTKTTASLKGNKTLLDSSTSNYSTRRFTWDWNSQPIYKNDNSPTL